MKRTTKVNSNNIRKAVFKLAWKIARSASTLYSTLGEASVFFAESLKLAWKIVKSNRSISEEAHYADSWIGKCIKMSLCITIDFKEHGQIAHVKYFDGSEDRFLNLTYHKGVKYNSAFLI